MAIIRAMGRSIFRNVASPLQPRWFSTATLTSEKETPTVQKPRRKGLLYHKVTKEHHTSGVANILSEWVSKGQPVRRFDVANICDFFRRKNKIDAALQLFDWVEASNLSINNTHHAIRINLLFKSRGGVASAEEYFNGLPASEKTGKTYGALLASFCKGMEFDKALDLFDKMKELNHVSTLNYNNMLLLHYSMEQPEKVLDLVQEMESKKIAFDQYSYNTLINSHAALKDFDGLEGVLEKMKINKFKQDSFTCGNIATIYFNAGSLDKAKAYLQKLEEFKNLEGDELFDACRTRLKLYSEMNDLSGVDRAWEALKSGFPSNMKYLVTLIAFSKLGEQERLEELYKQWEDQCRNFDMRIPNVLLDFYLSRDMIEKASSLHDSLVDKQDRINLRALDLFANLCIRKGQVDLALDYLDKGFDKAKPEHRKWFPTSETIDLLAKYFEENDDDGSKKRFAESIKRVSREIPSSLLSRIQVSDG